MKHAPATAQGQRSRAASPSPSGGKSGRGSTIVTVNRGVIDRNRKRGENRPPVRAARGKYGAVLYGHVIKLDTVPPVYFMHDQNNPLPHGARVWVQTDAKATVVK